MFIVPRFICCVFMANGFWVELLLLFGIEVRCNWLRSMIAGPVRFGEFNVDEVPVMPPMPLPGLVLLRTPAAPAAPPAMLPWIESLMSELPRKRRCLEPRPLL